MVGGYDYDYSNLRSGPCSTVAPHPTAVHIVPGYGIQFNLLSGKQTGRIQRLNSRPCSNRNTAKSFTIVLLLYCVWTITCVTIRNCSMGENENLRKIPACTS